MVTGIMVFINPAVASLPQHKHLIGGNGCYNGVIDNRDNGIPCTGADALPLPFQSLLNCKKIKSDKLDWKDVEWTCEKNQALAASTIV